MNRDPRGKAKHDFRKDLFKLMNNVLLGKTIGNARKHRDVKLAITERGRDYILSKPNHQNTKFFAEYLLAIEIKKNTDTYG